MGGKRCRWCKSDKSDDQGPMCDASALRVRFYVISTDDGCDPGVQEPDLTLGLGRVPRRTPFPTLLPFSTWKTAVSVATLAKIVRARVASVTEPFSDGARAPLN